MTLSLRVSPSRANFSAQHSLPGRVLAPVLAIDYGRRRIGLALSDALGLTAQPLAALERTNRRKDLRRLREIVRKYDVQRIVVGHPLRLDGSAGEMAAETARFAVRIEKQLGLSVELVDERLSTWEAEQMLAATRASARKQRGKAKFHRRGGEIDPVAAAVILRDFLEREHARKQAKG